MHYALAPGGQILVPRESLLRPLVHKLNTWLEPADLWRRFYRPMLAGILPAEGEVMVARMVFARFLTDRDANLELGLHTLASPSDSTDYAAYDAAEPTGTGYARITLVDATWGTANPITYTEQTFTAGAGGWTGSVQGYGINTLSSGGTQRLLVIEVDAAGPYTFAEDDTYDVTLSNTVSDPSD